MARPQKEGLDYFPFDIGLLTDKKLRRPKMKYGYLAIAVYLALLTLLYSDKGYYIPYETQKEKDDCIWYVLDCLQGKYQPDADTIAEVIEELTACELFSGDRYPKNITSKRSQAVYYSATVERKSIVIDEAIWLLNLDEMKNLSEKHIYYLSKLRQLKNGVNRSNNGVNRSNNPQSKVKKSKEYMCTNAHAREDTDTSKPTVEEISAYAAEIGKSMNAQRFWDFYESKGWTVGNQPMRDWRACVRSWEPRKGEQSDTDAERAREKADEEAYSDRAAQRRQRLLETDPEFYEVEKKIRRANIAQAKGEDADMTALKEKRREILARHGMTEQDI